MKRLIAFFTSNWGLKILALALALVIYYSMRDSMAKDSRIPQNPFLKGATNGGNN